MIAYYKERNPHYASGDYEEPTVAAIGSYPILGQCFSE